MSYLLSIDNSVLNLLSSGIKNRVFDRIMPIITNSNNHGEIWMAISIILIINKNTAVRRVGISMIIAVAVGYLLGDMIIKNITCRTRPISELYNFKFLISLPKSYSFPSGHTTSSFAAFGVCWFMKAKYKYWVLLLSVLIAFSRLYLHVHYPSDVLGGIILGLTSAKIGVSIVETYFRRKETK
jgi:undecaprenyl-diphosphatase